MRSEAERGSGFAASVAETGAMTLLGTIGISFHLRPDGSVWASEWVRDSVDPDEYQWRPATTQEAAGALREAAKRVPALAALVPVRPAGREDCADCHGTGYLTPSSPTIIDGIWCPRCCCAGFVVGEAA